MKELFIHIGYPKAASTTLQNALFMGLHGLGLINFLGRAFESDYFGFANSKEQFKQWLKELSSNDHYSSAYKSVETATIPDIFSIMSDKLINVLSEGAFILHERRFSDFIMPERIRGFFSDNVDSIRIIVVIRSQTTLIMSNYVQRYKKMEENTFAEYLDAHMNGKKRGMGDFKVFDFYNLAEHYAQVFGKDNVSFLLFEEMANDKEAFAASVANIINVDSKYINNCLGDNKLNVTTVDSDYHICKKPITRTARYQLGRFIKKLGFNPGEMITTKVPRMTEGEEGKVFDFFKENNLKLAEEFSLDTDKMRRYGYF